MEILTIYKKILIVGMLDSIHFARWLQTFENEKLDILLFPSTPNKFLNKKIDLLMKSSSDLQLKVYNINFLIKIMTFFLDKLSSHFVSSQILRRVILDFNPDVIHAIHLNTSGYITLSALKKIKFDKKLILTNWGSDIFWFQKSMYHKKKLKKLLPLATDYIAECNRDILLAKKFGFVGNTYPVVPNSGPIVLGDIHLTKCSERRVILIKGYSTFVGLAYKIMLSLLFSKKVSNYEIIVFSSDIITKTFAVVISILLRKKITTYKKKSLTEAQMLDIFSRSKVYIGLSQSDGISTSLLESISTGCFPLQSNTSCAGEWIKNNLNGILLDSFSPIYIASVLDSVLDNDYLLDNAMEINRAIYLERISNRDLYNYRIRLYN